MSKENLYEVTKNDRIIDAPKWAIGMSYKDDYIEFAWCETTVENRPDFVDYRVRVRVNGEKKHFNEYRDLFNIVKKVRMDEVYNEIVEKDELTGKPQTVHFMKTDEIANLIEEIYKRVCQGEFVGQSMSLIYLQEVAEILDIDLDFVLDIVEETLIPEKRIGLNGYILIDYGSYAKEKEALAKATGHKDISRSDFGSWFCHACGKSGNENESPTDKKCERVDASSYWE